MVEVGKVKWIGRGGGEYPSHGSVLFRPALEDCAETEAEGEWEEGGGGGLKISICDRLRPSPSGRKQRDIPSEK